jgi:hypothetical protein
VAFIDLQIATERLLQTLREGLREALVAVQAQEWTGLGQTLMFERIDVHDDTHLIEPERGNLVPKKWDDSSLNQSQGIDPLSSFPGVLVEAKPVMIEQTIELQPVLLTGRGTASPALQTLPAVSLTFSIEVGVDVVEDPTHPGQMAPRTRPVLSVTPFGLTFQPIPQVADALARSAGDQLATAIGSQNLDLPIPKMLSSMYITNAGIAALGVQTRVAIRIQGGFLPEIPTRTCWENFYAGSTLNPTDPALNATTGPPWDWGMQIDAGLFLDMIRDDLTDALKHPASSVWLANRGVQAGVGSSGGHLQITAQAFLDVATGVLGTQVEVEVDVVVDLEVIAGGDLRVAVNVDASVSIPIDTALLALAIAGAIPAVLGIVAAVVPGGMLIIIAAVLTAIDLLASLNSVPVNVLPKDLSSMCTEGPLNIEALGLHVHKTVTCEVSVRQTLPLTRTGQAELRQLFSAGDGVIAAGTLTPLPTLPRPPWSLDVSASPWAAPNIPCADAGNAEEIIDAFRSNPWAAVCVTMIRVDSPGPVTVVNAYVASADYGVASAAVTDGTHVQAKIHYVADFVSKPKPIAVLVHTTEGIRLVVLPPLPPFDLDALTFQMAGSIGRCFEAFRRYDVKWAVDPLLAVEGAFHLWDVRVIGVIPGEQLGLHAPNGDRLVLARAGRDGSAQLAHLTRPSAEVEELSIVRAVPADGSEVGEQGKAAAPTVSAVRIAQTRLVQRGIVETRDPVRGFDVGLINGKEMLVVVHAHSIELHDVSRPERPILTKSLDASGCRGAFIARNAIIVWGREGLQVLTPERNAASSPLQMRQLLDIRVDDAALLRGEILGLTAEGLVRRTSASSAVVVNESIRGRCLATVGQALVVATHDEVQVFDGVNAAEPSSRLAVRCEELLAPTLAASATVIARTRDSHVGIDVADPTAPHLAQSWPGVPQHAGAVASGPTIAMLVSEPGTIAILTRDQVTQL